MNQSHKYRLKIRNHNAEADEVAAVYLFQTTIQKIIVFSL